MREIWQVCLWVLKKNRNSKIKKNFPKFFFLIFEKLFFVLKIQNLANQILYKNLTGHHWMESSTEKSLIFSATAIGAVMGLVPSVPLIDSLGIRGVLSISGAFSALGTLFFPFSVDSNIYAVIFCRVLQGLGVSVIMTVVGVIPGENIGKNGKVTEIYVISI